MKSVSHSPLSAITARSCSCLEKEVSIFLPKTPFSLSKINVTYCHWQCPLFLSWLFKNPLSIPVMHGKHVLSCLWLTKFSTCRLHLNIWITFCLQNHFFQIFNSYWRNNCISLAFVFFNFSLWVQSMFFKGGLVWRYLFTLKIKVSLVLQIILIIKLKVNKTKWTGFFFFTLWIKESSFIILFQVLKYCITM